MYLPSLLAQTCIALLSYVCFGGLRLWRTDSMVHANTPTELIDGPAPLSRPQWITLGVIIILLVGVFIFKVDIGLFAVTLATVLSLWGMVDQEEAIKAVPWDTIMMVGGVSVLIALLETTGGMDLFTSILARLAAPDNVTGVIAFVTGALSAYSSSSGVVMPAFIAAVPGLITKLGGGDPAAIISAINVGSHVVDVSPLSTLGAICIANAAPHEDRNRLFQLLLIYGLSMAVIGALVCYVFFGLLW